MPQKEFTGGGSDISWTTHVTGEVRSRYLPESRATRLINSIARSAEKCRASEIETDLAEEFAFMMSLRFLVMNREVLDKKDYKGHLRFKNILELAAGTTPRGIDEVLRNDAELESRRIVETDLPAMVGLKKQVRGEIENVYKSVGRNLNWDFLRHAAVDITSADDVASLQSLFLPGEIGVISEGIFPYLSKDGARKAIGNVARILKESGGVWATDIATKQGVRKPIFQDKASQGLLARLYRDSGLDVEKLAFEDAEEAIRTFEAEGLKVQRVSGAMTGPDGFPANAFYRMEEIALERGITPERVQKLMRRKMFLTLECA